MLDRDRILAKLDELEGYVHELERYRPASVEAYRADLSVRRVNERVLQIAIECLIDVGEMFVRGLRLGLPNDEAGVVQRLAEHGILPAEDVAILRRMRGLRNVLVHLYGHVDDARVHGDLLRAPGDLHRLARAFREAADRHAGK